MNTQWLIRSFLTSHDLTWLSADHFSINGLWIIILLCSNNTLVKQDWGWLDFSGAFTPEIFHLIETWPLAVNTHGHSGLAALLPLPQWFLPYCALLLSCQTIKWLCWDSEFLLANILKCALMCAGPCVFDLAAGYEPPENCAIRVIHYSCLCHKLGELMCSANAMTAKLEQWLVGLTEAIVNWGSQ